MYGASLMRNEPSKQLCILCKRKPLGIYVKGFTSCKNKKTTLIGKGYGAPFCFCRYFVLHCIFKFDKAIVPISHQTVRMQVPSLA